MNIGTVMSAIDIRFYWYQKEQLSPPMVFVWPWPTLGPNLKTAISRVEELKRMQKTCIEFHNKGHAKPAKNAQIIENSVVVVRTFFSNEIGSGPHEAYVSHVLAYSTDALELEPYI